MARALRPKKGTVACPYCFVALDLSSVGFHCSGRPAAGRRPCVPHPNPRREAILGDSTAVLPPVLSTHDGYVVVDDNDDPELYRGRLSGSAQCHRCGGQTPHSICPACHSYLPPALAQGSLSVAVVGASYSGKTVWLTELDHRMLNALPRKFDSSIDHPGGTVGLADTLNTLRNELEGTRKLPNQTSAAATMRGAKQAPSVYQWAKADGSGSLVLSIYDTAGEDVARRDQALLQQHLTAANAVVLVLDPFAFRGNQALAHQRRAVPRADRAGGATADRSRLTTDVLDGLATALRSTETTGRGNTSAKLTTPVAVVVAKMDAFWDSLDPESPLLRVSTPDGYFDETASRLRHQAMKDLIHEWEGHQVVNKLETTFSDYRFFGVSALGGEPDYDTAQVRSLPTPALVEDPLLWLLAKQDFLKSKGG